MYVTSHPLSPCSLRGNYDLALMDEITIDTRKVLEAVVS